MLLASATDVTVDGVICFPPEGTCLSIGGTSSAGAYLNGIFDNVRVSDGVLDPSEFMGYMPAGMSVMIR